MAKASLRGLDEEELSYAHGFPNTLCPGHRHNILKLQYIGLNRNELYNASHGPAEYNEIASCTQDQRHSQTECDILITCKTVPTSS